MSQEDYMELKAAVDAVAVQDVHLGRVLSVMASHLPGYAEAAQAKADADAKAAEEAKAQAEAEAAPAEAPAPEAPVESEQAHAS